MVPVPPQAGEAQRRDVNSWEVVEGLMIPEPRGPSSGKDTQAILTKSYQKSSFLVAMVSFTLCLFGNFHLNGTQPFNVCIKMYKIPERTRYMLLPESVSGQLWHSQHFCPWASQSRNPSSKSGNFQTVPWVSKILSYRTMTKHFLGKW